MLIPIKFILKHPLTRRHKVKALLRFVQWQVISRIYKQPVIHQFTQHSKLWVWQGLKGATGNIYCGLHDLEDMAFLLHLLRPGDLFVDIGANIGSYTILASAEAGADSIAIEPIPATYGYLKRNIELNGIEKKVIALNMGSGSKKDILRFTKDLDTGDHVANAGEAAIEAQVDTLDTILNGRVPLLVKIDVEGFETEVLKGASNTLKAPGLKALIIELNGSGERYGFNEDAIHALLTDHGFSVMRYAPIERKLIKDTRNTEHNTLYVRDLGTVTHRSATAAPVIVQNWRI